jgi:hypothetical protein
MPIARIFFKEIQDQGEKERKVGRSLDLIFY